MTVPAMMPMVHEEVHQRTGENQEIGQHAKDMRGMLRQQEEPGHNQETAAHNPYRGPPPRLFVLFVIHGIRSVQDTSAEEVVERYEDPGDVPAPDEAFDEAEGEAAPAQQLEPW